MFLHYHLSCILPYQCSNPSPQYAVVSASVEYAARLWDVTAEEIAALQRNNLPSHLACAVLLTNPSADRDPRGGPPVLRDPAPLNHGVPPPALVAPPGLHLLAQAPPPPAAPCNQLLQHLPAVEEIQNKPARIEPTRPARGKRTRTTKKVGRAL